MKNIISTFLGLFLLTLSYNASAFRLLSRHTSHGNLNWYDKTTKDLVNYSYYNGAGELKWDRGWQIDCSDPGLTWCPLGGGIVAPTNPEDKGIDVIDDAKSQDLVQYVQTQFEGNINTGSHSILVQVEGESFVRVYTVTWNYDSLTSKYNTYVDRNDVVL